MVQQELLTKLMNQSVCIDIALEAYYFSLGRQRQPGVNADDQEEEGEDQFDNNNAASEETDGDHDHDDGHDSEVEVGTCCMMPLIWNFPIDILIMVLI